MDAVVVDAVTGLDPKHVCHRNLTISQQLVNRHHTGRPVIRVYRVRLPTWRLQLGNAPAIAVLFGEVLDPSTADLKPLATNLVDVIS